MVIHILLREAVKMEKESGQTGRQTQEAAWAAFLRTGSVENYLAYRGYRAGAGRRKSYASVDRRTDR
ncbi:MAG: hypothetical protein HFE86_03860 [Clostridiales bacterium]|nr:hypothetical protein [Clostridiales bacterium]